MIKSSFNFTLILILILKKSTSKEIQKINPEMRAYTNLIKDAEVTIENMENGLQKMCPKSSAKKKTINLFELFDKFRASSQTLPVEFESLSSVTALNDEDVNKNEVSYVLNSSKCSDNNLQTITEKTEENDDSEMQSLSEINVADIEPAVKNLPCCKYSTKNRNKNRNFKVISNDDLIEEINDENIGNIINVFQENAQYITNDDNLESIIDEIFEDNSEYSRKNNHKKIIKVNDRNIEDYNYEDVAVTVYNKESDDSNPLILLPINKNEDISSKKLRVQHMPAIQIQRGLIYQKVLNMNIKSDASKSYGLRTDNVGFMEFLHNDTNTSLQKVQKNKNLKEAIEDPSLPEQNTLKTKCKCRNETNQQQKFGNKDTKYCKSPKKEITCSSNKKSKNVCCPCKKIEADLDNLSDEINRKLDNCKCMVESNIAETFKPDKDTSLEKINSSDNHTLNTGPNCSCNKKYADLSKIDTDEDGENKWCKCRHKIVNCIHVKNTHKKESSKIKYDFTITCGNPGCSFNKLKDSEVLEFDDNADEYWCNCKEKDYFSEEELPGNLQNINSKYETIENVNSKQETSENEANDDTTISGEMGNFQKNIEKECVSDNKGAIPKNIKKHRVRKLHKNIEDHKSYNNKNTKSNNKENIIDNKKEQNYLTNKGDYKEFKDVNLCCQCDKPKLNQQKLERLTKTTKSLGKTRKKKRNKNLDNQNITSNKFTLEKVKNCGITDIKKSATPTLDQNIIKNSDYFSSTSFNTKFQPDTSQSNTSILEQSTNDTFKESSISEKEPKDDDFMSRIMNICSVIKIDMANNKERDSILNKFVTSEEETDDNKDKKSRTPQISFEDENKPKEKVSSAAEILALTRSIMDIKGKIPRKNVYAKDESSRRSSGYNFLLPKHKTSSNLSKTLKQNLDLKGLKFTKLQRKPKINQTNKDTKDRNLDTIMVLEEKETINQSNPPIELLSSYDDNDLVLVRDTSLQVSMESDDKIVAFDLFKPDTRDFVIHTNKFEVEDENVDYINKDLNQLSVDNHLSQSNTIDETEECHKIVTCTRALHDLIGGTRNQKPPVDKNSHLNPIKNTNLNYNSTNYTIQKSFLNYCLKTREETMKKNDLKVKNFEISSLPKNFDNESKKKLLPQQEGINFLDKTDTYFEELTRFSLNNPIGDNLESRNFDLLNYRRNLFSSDSEEFDLPKTGQESLSEGETLCKCSVSSGELHFCDNNKILKRKGVPNIGSKYLNEQIMNMSRNFSPGMVCTSSSSILL